MILARATLGLIAAATTAALAQRAHSLSRSGAIAAAAVGTAAVAAGWRWGALLLLYFASAALLSKLGAEKKARRSGGVVEKGGARDAVQVLANGGVFACCAIATLVAGGRAGEVLAAAALGALAASAADTWATEVGLLWGGAPRSLLTLRRCPPGTSGAVSVVGTLALVAGGAAIALLARSLGLGAPVYIVAVAGAAGAMADTLLGATLQERRWCDACGVATERHVHDCGAMTRPAGGQPWLDNDAVNLVATILGAGVAAILASTQG